MAYSGLFGHVHKLAIFQVLAYLRPQPYSKKCETLAQNPAIARTVYSSIIQPY